MKNDLKIIFISAYCDEHTINDAFESKPDSYITKPFTEEQLLVVLRRVLANTKLVKTRKKNGFPTKRESQIMHCITHGLTSRAIAKKLGISFETVQTHRKNLLHKYSVHTSAELVLHAVKNHWVD